jgi:uncharacterized membrane protein YdfJ with MMPL/SSD domain
VFAGWGSWVARFRWPVLAVALVAVVSAGAWGLGVFGQLSEGGYNDPTSESTRAARIVQETLGARGGDVVAIYTPVKGTIDDAGLGKRIRARLSALPRTAVTTSRSYWQQKSAQYAAKDKSSAVAVITLAGRDDAAKLAAYRAIDDKLAVSGATVRLAGATPLADASNTRSTDDLGFAELISLPITLVLLLLLFGSLVAAALPVLVGGAAVLGSLGILHAIASNHDVNSFAVNVASLLGLGMAIDYGLFIVGRFREEQAEGRTPAEAVRRTVGTAGRTVLFSATLLIIALAGLLLFPQGYLKSLAYGGLAAVALAAVLSLTLLPALLAVLGPRVDKLPVRLPRRRNAKPAGSGWARLAGFVLRRPVLVVLPIIAGLLVLAAPIRGAHFGESDERVLPAGDPSRQAIETLKDEYPQLGGDAVQIVLRGTRDSAAFATAARKVPGVAEVGPAQKATNAVIFTARLTSKDPFSTSARDAVDGIRALPVPAGAQLLVGGTTARNVDSLQATADKLPLMIGMLVGATLLLMFLAFGSILLPIKAVVMSAISLCATFGILVWIFQDGHGSGVLDITPAPLEVGIVVLMAAVVFGLSTDYEVFLLSRMVEARTRGASTTDAVTAGLSRTGRVISAAALLLIVVTGAFALSSVTTMRFVGVGMIVALLLDATVVRMLLVPAVLALLGDAAWWAPGPLRRLQQRAGLAEYGPEDLYPTVSVGRHAAPDDAAILTGIVGYGSFPGEKETLALPAGPGPRPDAGSGSGSGSGQDDRPAWARPSSPLPALPTAVSPFALPAAPHDTATDVTAVFPAIVDDTATLPTIDATPPVDAAVPADAALPSGASPAGGSVDETAGAEPVSGTAAEVRPAEESADEPVAVVVEPVAADDGPAVPSAGPDVDVPVAADNEPTSADAEAVAAGEVAAEHVAAEHVAAGAEPVAVPAEHVPVDDEPVAVAAEPVAVAAEPVAIATERVAVEDEPVAVPAEPVAVAADPVAATTERVAAEDEPGAVAAEPVAVAAEPVPAAAERVAVEDEPVAVAAADPVAAEPVAAERVAVEDESVRVPAERVEVDEEWVAPAPEPVADEDEEAPAAGEDLLTEPAAFVVEPIVAAEAEPVPVAWPVDTVAANGEPTAAEAAPGPTAVDETVVEDTAYATIVDGTEAGAEVAPAAEAEPHGAGTESSAEPPGADAEVAVTETTADIASEAGAVTEPAWATPEPVSGVTGEPVEDLAVPTAIDWTDWSAAVSSDAYFSPAPAESFTGFPSRPATEDADTALPDRALATPDRADAALPDSALAAANWVDTALSDPALADADPADAALPDPALAAADRAEAALPDRALANADRADAALPDLALANADRADADLADAALTDAALTDSQPVEADERFAAYELPATDEGDRVTMPWDSPDYWTNRLQNEARAAPDDDAPGAGSGSVVAYPPKPEALPTPAEESPYAPAAAVAFDRDERDFAPTVDLADRIESVLRRSGVEYPPEHVHVPRPAEQTPVQRPAEPVPSWQPPEPPASWRAEEQAATWHPEEKAATWHPEEQAATWRPAPEPAPTRRPADLGGLPPVGRPGDLATYSAGTRPAESGDAPPAGTDAYPAVGRPADLHQTPGGPAGLGSVPPPVGPAGLGSVPPPIRPADLASYTRSRSPVAPPPDGPGAPAPQRAPQSGPQPAPRPVTSGDEPQGYPSVPHPRYWEDAERGAAAALPEPRPVDDGGLSRGWRPVILGDHGREPRPADLGEYSQPWRIQSPPTAETRGAPPAPYGDQAPSTAATRGARPAPHGDQSPQSRRPTTLGDQSSGRRRPDAADPAAGWRPATLADQLPGPGRPARQRPAAEPAPEDTAGPTQDLSAHGDQGGVQPRP